jgi:hypothetical protein
LSSDVYGKNRRAASGNFFSVTIPLKAVCLEEKIHHEVEKVEEGRENEALYRNLCDFFSSSLIDRVAVFFAVKKFSKTW